MSEQFYEIRVVATGEVRDAQGNLLSTPTIEFDPQRVSEAQLAELSSDSDQEK